MPCSVENSTRREAAAGLAVVSFILLVDWLLSLDTVLTVKANRRVDRFDFTIEGKEIGTIECSESTCTALHTGTVAP